MYNFDTDPETRSQKLAEKIKKLQEEKAELDKNLETEKRRHNLARKAGIIIISEFQGKPFEYQAFEALLDKHLTDDFDREFFKLKPLAADDPRRAKPRGRRKKETVNE